MPRKPQSDIDLDDPLSEGAGEVIETEPARPYQTKTAPPLPTPAPFDMTQFASVLASALASALGQQGQTTAQAIQEATAAALQSARTKIPENEQHPDISAYNPHGERDHPRPGLRCPMYLGQYNEDDEVQPAFEILGDVCTWDEQMLLNQVRAGVYPFQRNDGKRGRVIVQERKDEGGNPRRLVIAFPHGWLSKDQQAFLPSQTRIAEQLIPTAG